MKEILELLEKTRNELEADKVDQENRIDSAKMGLSRAEIILQILKVKLESFEKALKILRNISETPPLPEEKPE